MILTNYHSHTHFCDGTDDPSVYVAKAKELGMTAYGFSGHCPVPFDNQWSMKRDGAAKYVKEVNALKDQHKDDLQIYLGMEVDYVPDEVGPRHPDILAYDLDYTVGSVHYTGKYDDGSNWCIDDPTRQFEVGLDAIFNNDIEAAVTRYYELTRMMLEESCPDIVGHLDKIKMHNAKKFFFDEQAEWYQNQVDLTLEAVADSGAIMELNTRGLYKKHANQIYPSPWVLERAYDMDIPVMVNSDGHHPREIVAGFDTGYKVLHDIGYKEVTVLLDHEWQGISIEQAMAVT